MVLDAFGQALLNFADVGLWLVMFAGAIIGLVFGIIPGLSGITACALLLPFVFKMTPLQAFPLMMAIVAAVFNGGGITAILLNVPGTAGNAATLLDGFPMTQKGEGGRALGAQQMGSMMGTAFMSLLSLALIPVILRIVMGIQSSDMLFVILLALTFIAVLESGSLIKALISGVMGLLVAFIGNDAVTGAARFTFGSDYLYDGVPLVPVALGLFAVPEMVALATSGGTIARAEALIKGMAGVWQGARDAFRHWWLVLRSATIGGVAGVLPGVGPSIAAFIAYGHAKQTSKHPEKFGTGTVEGVIASEVAHNACSPGDLLTTLALGIPGSGVMSLLLAAMIMLGIVPGPGMLIDHLSLSLTLFWNMIVACLMATAISLWTAPQLARIARVPGYILVPLIIVIAFVGAFAANERINDIIMTLVFGVVGLAMKRFGYERPALFLGYILGGYFEKYLFIALQAAGPLFFLRPISLSLIVITVAMFCFPPIKRLFERKRKARAGSK